jgi:hypothetical protein
VPRNDSEIAFGASEYRLAISMKGLSWWPQWTAASVWGGPMARNLREVIAALPAEWRAKIAAAHTQKLIAEEQVFIAKERMLNAEEQMLIAEKKKRQWEEAKRVMELDRNLIVIVVLIVALPIIAALAAMLPALAVGYQ